MARAPKPEAGRATLAELLAEQREAVDELAEAARRREAEQAAAAKARAERAAIRRLDEAALMALIFEQLDADNLRVARGIDWERVAIVDEPEPEPTADVVDSQDPPARAPAPKAEPMPAREPLDPARALVGHEFVGRGWIDDVRPVAPEVLDRPSLSPEQRALLVRAGRRTLASCNLRRLRREPALALLELFIRACRGRRARFCRVIPGKGVDSRAEPVIKRAVLAWCRAPGQRAVLAWAPELDEHGEWGSLVLELRRVRG